MQSIGAMIASCSMVPSATATPAAIVSLTDEDAPASVTLLLLLLPRPAGVGVERRALTPSYVLK